MVRRGAIWVCDKCVRRLSDHLSVDAKGEGAGHDVRLANTGLHVDIPLRRQYRVRMKKQQYMRIAARLRACKRVT